MNFKTLAFAAALIPSLFTTSVSAFPTVPKIPGISFADFNYIDVGVTWSNTNTPTYRFKASGFTPEQSENIRTALVYIYHVLSASGSSTSGPMSSFQQCVSSRTTRDHNPNWMPAGHETRTYVNAIRSAFMVLGGGGGTIKAYTAVNDEPEFTSSARGAVLTISAGSVVEVYLNTVALSSMSIAELARVLFHEMLHNSGWTHPYNGLTSDYPGTFIAEADACMRGEIILLNSNAGLATKSNHFFMAK